MEDSFDRTILLINNCYSSVKPTVLCEPSQNGIVRDAPQRQSVNLSRTAPSGHVMSSISIRP